MKRGRGEKGGSYTGGTGDIKPQYWSLAGGTQGAVDQYRVDDFTVPIVRPGSAGNNATIMEMLELEWYPIVGNQADPAVHHFAFLSANTNRSTGDASTLATAIVDLADPRTFGFVMQTRNVSTNGGFASDLPVKIDLTDQNGNGMLWAGDKITLVTGGVNQAVVGATICKVKYRFVKVSLIEYLGIVQSQQS